MLNKDSTKFDVLSASTWINVSWNKISSSITAKCFIKAGFSSYEKDNPYNLIEISLEVFIFQMTNLLQSAGEN